MVKKFVPNDNEKFHHHGNDVYQGQVGYITFIAHAYNAKSAKRITDKFNELITEIKRLQKENDTLRRDYNDCYNDNRELLDMEIGLNTSLKDERLKLWRLKNHLKLIGWSEEFIQDITDNTFHTLEIKHED